MENKVEIDLNQFSDLGVTDVEGLASIIREANEVKKNQSFNAEAFKKELLEELKATTELASTRGVEAVNEKEADKLDDLETSGLLKAFDSETDPVKKMALIEKASLQYGERNAQLAFAGTNFTKAMTGPVRKTDEHYEIVKDMREIHDLALTIAAMEGGIQKMSTRDNAKVDMAVFNKALNDLKRAGYDTDTYRKAAADTWDTLDAGNGLEWLPVNMSANVVEAVFLPLRVASLFQRETMTSKVWRMPVAVGRARAGLMPETTTNADLYTTQAPISVYNSADVTFTSKKLGVTQGFSDEIEQDAIVSVARRTLASIVQAIGTSIEDAILNGDAAGFATLDNAGGGGNELWATTAAAQGRDAWSGIRKAMGSTVKVDAAGALTVPKMRAAATSMGRYGVGTDQGQLVWIVGISAYQQIKGLPEVLTLDKFGPNATILKGQIASIDDIPIVISELVYQNLNASGVYDNVTKTKTAMYLVYRDAWAIGDRRLLRVEQDRVIVSQQNVAVGSWRGDFEKLQGTELTEAQIYNLTT